ncbi:hypothetical protein NLJ89_g3533 [Agrocybe chaxingu]|uniref:BAG domain-containing protein n=1 Tax=Agrocybe chaxingu TaxID=84603 RepID=A0A9W8MWT3_9AGAR|nr:hypothetical protein NLJ89_g3533 [Agrocybe chaxingu]
MTAPASSCKPDPITIDDIQSYLDDFHLRRNAFPDEIPQIVFFPDFLLPLPSLPPSLPPHENSSFLQHQQHVEQIQDFLLTIPADAPRAIRDLRNTAMAEVQEHMKELDDALSTEWKRMIALAEPARASLRTVQDCYEQFQELISPFKNGFPAIMFSACQPPLPSTPPPLEFGLNKTFLLHREAITRLLSKLDGINSYDLQMIRNRRKSAVQEVQAHLESLDTLVSDSWKTAVAQSRSPSRHLLNEIDKSLKDFNVMVDRFKRDKPLLRFLSSYENPPMSPPPALPVALNGVYLHHRDGIERILSALKRIPTGDDSVRDRKARAEAEVSEHVGYLDDIVKKAWDEVYATRQQNRNTGSVVDPKVIVPCDEYFDTTKRLRTMSSAILVSFSTAIILHLLPGLSREASNFLLTAMKIIITAACTTYVKRCFRDAGIEGIPTPNPLDEQENGSPWAAVVLLIADAPAARKAAGFPSMTSSNFCNFCLQTASQLADFNVDTWSSRTRESHLAAAIRWRDAPDEATRKMEWKQNHIRWSELLRLPYWDPTKHVVVDPMHNLFLNLASHHIRDFWGVHEKETHGRKGVVPHTTEEQEKYIKEATAAITHQNLSALRKLRRTYLDAFAAVNQVELLPSDKSSAPKLGAALISWVYCSSYLFAATS